jgi:predicted membrane channel-forming protein YqfA (hemolysin III family)
MLGVAFGLLVVATVGNLVMDGLRGAVSPAFGMIVLGIVGFRHWRNPPPPQLWSKQRVIGTAVVLGLGSTATIACLVWVAAINPGWELLAVAVGGILFVFGAIFWMLRLAQAEHREALTLARESEN